MPSVSLCLTENIDKRQIWIEGEHPFRCELPYPSLQWLGSACWHDSAFGHHPGCRSCPRTFGRCLEHPLMSVGHRFYKRRRLMPPVANDTLWQQFSRDLARIRARTAAICRPGCVWHRQVPFAQKGVQRATLDCLSGFIMPVCRWACPLVSLPPASAAPQLASHFGFSMHRVVRWALVGPAHSAASHLRDRHSWFVAGSSFR